jgi:hypothetical protein
LIRRNARGQQAYGCEGGERKRTTHEATASGVDEHSGLFHERELLRADKVAVGVHERGVERDDVRADEQFVERRDALVWDGREA